MFKVSLFPAVPVLAAGLALLFPALADAGGKPTLAPPLELPSLGVVSAGPPPRGERLTLIDREEALRRALERGPQIAEARASARAAFERIEWARSLPDPAIAYVEHVDGVQTRTGEQQRAVSLSQRFPWPGTRSARAEQARERAMAAGETARDQARETTWVVAGLHRRLGYELQARQITERERLTVRGLFDSARAAYAAGSGSRAEMLKAQAELARLESKMAAHDGTIGELRAALREWIGEPPEGTRWTAPLAPVPILRVDETQLVDLVLAGHPRLGHLDHRQRAAELEWSLARRTFAPDVNLAVQWIDIGSRPDDPMPPPPGEGDDAWSVSLSFSLPLRAGRRHAAERAALEDMKAIEHGRRGLRERLRAQTSTLRERLDATRDELTLVEQTLIPLAEESFAAARAAYAGGKGRFLDLLDAERTLLDARLERLRLARDYGLALIDIERLVGRRIVPGPAQADLHAGGGSDDAS